MGANINGIAQSSGELTLSVHGATKSISLFDSATGEMKNTYQVFEDINQYWKEMDDNEKQALATTIAGKNHMEVFTAIMGNFGSVLNATQTAILSQGSAMRENEAVLDSFEGHISRFSAAYENLATRMVDSDMVKGFIDFGTTIVNVLSQIADSTVAKTILITTALAGIGKSFGIFEKLATGGIDKTVAGLTEMISVLPSILKMQGKQGPLLLMNENAQKMAQSTQKATAALKSFVITGLAVGAFMAFRAALQQQTKEFENLKEQVDQTRDKLATLNEEREALTSKGNLTVGEESRLAILNAEIQANETLLKQEAQKQFQYQYEGKKTVTGGQHGRYETASVDTGTEKLRSQITTLVDLENQWKSYEQQIGSLDSTMPDYTDKVLELSQAQDKVKESMDKIANASLGELAGFQELYEMTGMSVDSYDELIALGAEAAEAYYNLTNGASAGAEANSIFANSFAEVEEEANLATEALQAYATASELPEYDANFKSYSDAWNTLNGEIEAGRTHSRAFQAAAELLFGQDWLERVNYSTDAIKTQTEALRQFFESGESGGANLINTLDSMTNSEGQIVTATGEVIGQFKQLEDGSSVLELPNENLAKLAETLGMDEGALVSMLQAWNMFGEGFSMFDTANLVEDLGNAGKAFGDFADGSGKAVVNLDEARAELEASGKSAWEIHDILQQISDDPAVITVEGEQSVDDAYNMVHELGLEIESVDGESINISTESLSNLIQVMGLSESQAEELINKLAQVDGVQFIDVAGNAQTAQGAIEAVHSSASETEGAIGTLKQALGEAKSAIAETQSQRPFDQAKQSADGATSSIRILGREFNALPTQKIMTIIVNKIKNYDEEATGTNSAPGGLTLVGEEYAPDGKPRPELVVANGKARLVGTNGPEFVNLPKGAQVYPYKKTKEMLRNGHLPEEVDAYAGGTVDAVRQQATGGTSSSSSNKKPTTSSGSGSGSGSKSKTPSTPSKSKASDNKALKEQNDLFKEQIDVMEHNLFLMQKRGASIQEQTEYMALMQQELNNQANYFRSKGVAENDEFIRALQKQWWSLRDDIVDSMSDSLDETLDILEHHAFLLEKQNHDTTYQRVDIYKEAQDKIHALAEQYRAMGLSEDSKEIQELQKMWWDYYDKRREAERDLLEQRKAGYETAINYMVRQIDKQIDQHKKEQEAIKDKYDAQIDALKELDDELERNTQLQEAQNKLAQAQAKRIYIFKNGEFQYIADVKAVNEAQQELNKIQKQNKLDADVKALEDARDAEIKAIDEILYGEGGSSSNPTGGLLKYKEEWANITSDFEDAQDELFALQVLGLDIEKKNWEDRITQAEFYAGRYAATMRGIIELQDEVNHAFENGFTLLPPGSNPQPIQKTTASTSRTYASGTLSAYGGLSLVGEQGAELRVLNRGDGIIPTKLTENLMRWGQIAPEAIFNKAQSAMGNLTQAISVGNITLPNVHNADQFMNELKSFKTYALQLSTT